MARQLSERQAYLVLNALPDIGPISIRRLLDSFGGDPCEILNASESRLRQIERIGPVAARSISQWTELVDLEKEENALQKQGAQFISKADPNYPASLKQLYDSPTGLYCLGDASCLPKQGVAIVGTRRPTLYGRSIAKRLAGELVRAGYCIVSGMARGIDAEAHQGALDAGGPTIAVLGCGVDIVYPPEHIDLYRQIQKQGAVISEFKLGRRADKQTFPMRNRVIAGMTLATLVIESGAHGGSMITARFAGESGKQVFAVPGRIDQASSEGCHALIRDGATLVTCVDDILSDLQSGKQQELFGSMLQESGSSAKANQKAESILESLTPTERKVAECFMDGGQLTPDSLSTQLDMPSYEISGILVLLELRRIIGKRADGSFERLH